MNNNYFELSGLMMCDLELSHDVKGEKYYQTTIACKRSSGVIDNINVIISERYIFEDFYCGNYVYITGSLRTRNIKINNKNTLQVFMFADTIEGLECEDDFEYIDENNVEIIGYICKKSDIRYTPISNRKITDFIVAVNRDYSKSDYIPCVAWNKNAIYTTTLPVGKKVKITGRFQSREYCKNDIVKTAYELSISNINELE